MKTRIFNLAVMFIISLMALSLFVAKSDAQGIKERMKARLPIIGQLKSKGLVGENNKGYIEFISEKKENADAVSAENKDRRMVYTHIAKKTGSTVENAGMRRAQVIAQKAKSGEWLQDKSGKWFRKP